MLTGAAYIRVSTDDQTELSPDSQLKAIRKYAKEHNIILNEQYIYSDEGISGRTAVKRPAFMQMIAVAKLKPKPFDVILVWKLSRFARSREDSIVYKSMLKKECGIDVVSVSEPLGDDKTSILIEALLEAMDEYYSVNLAEEVRRGMTEKISRGGIVVAPPIGYKISGGKYVPDDNAHIVRKIFEDFAAGKKTLHIVRELNELGYRTQNGKLYQVRSINYILSNPTYIGMLRWTPGNRASSQSNRYCNNENTIISKGEHEPIISEELYNAVQERIKQNGERYPAHYHQRSTEYYFRGIVRCSNCGATLSRLSHGKEPSMQCVKYSHGICTESHSIYLNTLKKVVIEKMRQDADSENIQPNIIRVTPGENSAQTEALQASVNKLQVKLERIKAAYVDGIDTLEEYKSNKAKLTAELQRINSQLEQEQAIGAEKEIDYAAFRDKLTSVVEIISSADISAAEFNDTLLSIVSKIIFNRKTTSIEIFYKI